ncbi:hypothetical protein GCM10020220_111680 [Nonomuraea rubra]
MPQVAVEGGRGAHEGVEETFVGQDPGHGGPAEGGVAGLQAGQREPGLLQPPRHVVPLRQPAVGAGRAVRQGPQVAQAAAQATPQPPAARPPAGRRGRAGVAGGRLGEQVECLPLQPYDRGGGLGRPGVDEGQDEFPGKPGAPDDHGRQQGPVVLDVHMSLSLSRHEFALPRLNSDIHKIISVCQ